MVTIPVTGNRVNVGSTSRPWTIYEGIRFVESHNSSPWRPSLLDNPGWLSCAFTAIPNYTTLTPSQISQMAIAPPVTGTPEIASATITYPDDESFSGAGVSADYRESPYVWNVSFVGIQPVGYQIHSLNEATLTISARVLSYQHPNSATTVVTNPVTQFEFDTGGEPIVTTAVYDDTQPGDANHSMWACAPVEITVSGTSPRFRARNSLGQLSRWCTIRFAPIADGAVDAEDLSSVELDGTDSYDMDGTVVEWQWVLGTAKPEDASESGFWADYEYEGTSGTYVVSSSPQATTDASVLENVSFESDLIPVTMRVKDSAGFWSDSHVFYFEAANALFGSFVDRFGTLYTAVNEGQNVRVSRFKSDAPVAREILASIPDVKNPSLFQKANGDIICAATDRTTGDFVRKISHNFGRSFN